MHLAVDLDRLDHLAAVGLQAAVEVVQADARRGTCRPVEELARPPLADRVVALLLPARNQVVTLLEDHTAQGGDLLGRILQVGVHGDHHLAARSRKAAIESGRLAVVARKTDAPQRRILRGQALDNGPRAVGRAVVHEDCLIGEGMGRSDTVDPRQQFGQRLLLVVERYDDRDVGITRLHFHARRRYRDCGASGRR